MTHAPDASNIRRHDIHPSSEGIGWALAALCFVAAGAILWAGARLPGGLAGRDVRNALVAAGVGVAIVAFGRWRSRFGVELGPQGLRSTAPDAEWIPWSAVHDIRMQRLRQRVALFDEAGARLAVLPLDLSRADRAVNDIAQSCSSAAATLARPLPATFAPAWWARLVDGAVYAVVAVVLPFVLYGATHALLGRREALVAAVVTIVGLVMAIAYGLRRRPRVTTIDTDGITVGRGRRTVRIAWADVRAVELRRIYRSSGEGGVYDLDVLVVDSARRAVSIGTRLCDPFALYFTVRSIIAPREDASDGHGLA